MDLLDILRSILTTKNQIKTIIGENDNLSRYHITIHNMLAYSYNEGFRAGYHDRYFELHGVDYYPVGPVNPMTYNVDSTYYDSFTTEILTDISRDVLNYKLNIKEEIEDYINEDIGLLWEDYPTYLDGVKNAVYSYGQTDGAAQADEDYEGDANVEAPTFSFSNNRFTITSTQSEALLMYKIESNGVERVYTGPVTISESCRVYYYARIGRSFSDRNAYEDVTWDPNGFIAFVSPPVINQEDKYITINTSTKYANIEYCIDNGDWQTYVGRFIVAETSNTIKARAFKENEYSKTVSQPISHVTEADRPANVECSIVDNGSYRTITLTCATVGASIYYAINEGTDGYYRLYSNPVQENADNFLVFCYSEKDGVESKNRLVYRWSSSDDTNTPADVEFSDQGTSIILYTMTDGATVSYRFGASGEFINSQRQRIELTPDTSVTIYAFSQKDGYTSRNITNYRFNPGNTASSGKPAKPTMMMSPDNVVSIYSQYPVRYTINNTDPVANGITYNSDQGVRIKEFTTIRAVAVNAGKYSDEAITSFTPYSNTEGNDYGEGGGGSQGGGGGQEGGGQSGSESSNYFWVTGVTAITTQRSFKYRVGENGSWIDSNGSGLGSMNPTNIYYIDGNVGRVISFTGNAVVGGNVLSIVSANSENPSLENLFNSCTGLVDASKLRIPFTTLKEKQLKRTFANCTNLQYTPSTFLFTDVPSEALYETFKGCYNLKNTPSFTIENIWSNGCYSTFENCGKLEAAGSFDLHNIGPNAMANCFKNCTSLYGISLKTNNDNTLTPDSAFSSCFFGCQSLRSTESTINLGLTTLANQIYMNMFNGCSSLLSFGNLVASELADSCYWGMFENCTNLTIVGNINATTLANSAMRRMFYGCTSLGYPPELLCRNLFGYNKCYAEMFMNCTNLHYIKAMFINNPSGGGYTGNWVKNVSPSGTFVQNTDATWTYVGDSGIPTGWTVEKAAPVGIITNIWPDLAGLIHIEANNSDEIWYSVTATQNEDPSIMQKYTEPFTLGTTSYVNARCKNADGVWGKCLSIQIEVHLPGIVISCSNNKVYIYCPYDFEYDFFEYQIYEYQTETLQINWTTYNEPFTIGNSFTIKARGSISGNKSDIFTADLMFGVNCPVISFYHTYNGNHTQILNTYCAISYPNPELNPVLYYKINDLTIGTPPTGWTQYPGQAFSIKSYLTDETPTVVVSAIAQVTKDGQTVWSSSFTRQFNRDSEIELPIPKLRQISGTNNVILVIDDIEYPNWTDTAVQIQYKYDQGGETRIYEHTINMAENTNLFSSQNVYMYVRASGGANNTTKWNAANNEQPYVFYFDNTLISFDVHLPKINVVDNPNTNTSTLYITNSDTYPNYTTVNYFRIEVTDWTQDTHPRTEDYHYNYAPFSAADGLQLNKNIVKCTIYAKTQIKDSWSNEDGVTEAVYNWTNPYAITSIPAPTTSYFQKLANGTYKFYITNPAGYTTDNCYFYMLTDPEPQWAASGTVNEDKYTLADPNAPYTVGRYGLTIDQNLGYGVFRCWYEYAGLTSDTFDIEFNNPDVVTVLWPPEINIATSADGKMNILLLTNNYNNNVWLQYRIIDHPDYHLQWTGGVVDTNKYADWKNCSIYGETLSEYLSQGRIEARTYVNSEKISEISTRDFKNGLVEQLYKPQIDIIKENGHVFFTVTNKNKRAINWYTLDDINWDGYQLNPNPPTTIGPEVCHIYGNDLNSGQYSHIVSCTIKAYSQWGDDISDITEAEYVSDNVINSDPPTITVTKNADNMTFTVTITNNALVSGAAQQYYPRIKYHIINCTWTGDEASTRTYIHQGAGDDWLINNQGSSFTFTINEHLLEGTIEAFATDASGHMLNEDCHKTAVVQYEFNVENF